MGEIIEADVLGDTWTGYHLRIAGGNGEQELAMKQGVRSYGRVRLLLKKDHSCHRSRRSDEKKIKYVRGCIVDADMWVLALVIIKKSEQELPGLTRQLFRRDLVLKEQAKFASFTISPRMMMASLCGSLSIARQG